MVDKEFDKMVELIDDIDDNAHIHETRWDGCVAIANSDKIATELLNQYTEPLNYTLLFKDSVQNPIICLNEQENIYIFNYKAVNYNINELEKPTTVNLMYNFKGLDYSKFKDAVDIIKRAPIIIPMNAPTTRV